MTKIAKAIRASLIFLLTAVVLFFGVGYQYNFTKKSVIDDYGGLYLKLGMSI